MVKQKYTYIDNQGGNFTKLHTQIAKGIAILLMVYHHLFVIPERLNFDYFALPNIFGYNMQSVMANFSKVCVCIFVFLSGIGLYYSLSKCDNILSMYKKVGIKALSFMLNFWIIAILVYPLGVLLGFFNFNYEAVIRVIFADYRGVMEWWFVKQYIVLLAMAPIIIYFLNEKSLFKRILPVLGYSFCG